MTYKVKIMNEDIDLIEILDGCPKWTPFYSQVFGNVFFIRIETCASGKYIVFAFKFELIVAIVVLGFVGFFAHSILVHDNPVLNVGIF